MTLWTIQTFAAWQHLVSTGTLSTSEQFVPTHFLPAYQYMAQQMSQRGLVRPRGVLYPIWAWYQWEGKRKPRNAHDSGLADSKTKLCQLEIQIPDNQVLLSDFDAWHYVLNDSYLYLSPQDQSDNQPKTPDQRRDSWSKIFDVFHQVDKTCYYTAPLASRSIQATFWQLHLSQVKKHVWK